MFLQSPPSLPIAFASIYSKPYHQSEWQAVSGLFEYSLQYSCSSHSFSQSFTKNKLTLLCYDVDCSWMTLDSLGSYLIPMPNLDSQHWFLQYFWMSQLKQSSILILNSWNLFLASFYKLSLLIQTYLHLQARVSYHYWPCQLSGSLLFCLCWFYYSLLVHYYKFRAQVICCTEAVDALLIWIIQLLRSLNNRCFHDIYLQMIPLSQTSY